jgi:hypothetical protein
MDPEKDADALEETSAYLTQKGHHESALHILVAAKRYEEVNCTN